MEKVSRLKCAELYIHREAVYGIRENSTHTCFSTGSTSHSDSIIVLQIQPIEKAGAGKTLKSQFASQGFY